MKKILIAIIAGFALTGCTDKKAKKKAILDSVLAVHDKVMGAEGQLMKNKMQLDTLIKQNNLPSKDSAYMLRAKLTVADSAMDNWMHNFDYEQKGKSDDEIIVYMNAQKKQIIAIDSQLNTAVSESNKYLVKTKKK
jgi:hypothetical protein